MTLRLRGLVAATFAPMHEDGALCLDAVPGIVDSLVEAGISGLFVSGTTGFDYSKMTISDDVAEQTEQTFTTIKAALAEFGASLEDVVRVRVFIVDIGDWETICRIVGKHFKAINPANTTVVSPLVDTRMKVEIEVTARKRQS